MTIVAFTPFCYHENSSSLLSSIVAFGTTAATNSVKVRVPPSYSDIIKYYELYYICINVNEVYINYKFGTQICMYPGNKPDPSHSPVTLTRQ